MISRPLPCRLAALTLAVTATLFGTMAQAAAFADQIYVNGVVYTVDANDSGIIGCNCLVNGVRKEKTASCYRNRTSDGLKFHKNIYVLGF